MRASRSLYLPFENLSPEQRRKISSIYKVNDLLLEGIRKKVEAAIGPNRFAVLLAPTKYEYGMEELLPAMGDPAAVARGPCRPIGSRNSGDRRTKRDHSR